MFVVLAATSLAISAATDSDLALAGDIEMVAEKVEFGPEAITVASGGGVWIEDDGFTTAHRDGAVARTAVRLWDRAGGRLRLEIGRREGGYEPPRRLLRIGVHACPSPNAVLLDGTRLAAGDATPGQRRRDGRVEVRFEDDGRAHTLEIEPAP